MSHMKSIMIIIVGAFIPSFSPAKADITNTIIKSVIKNSARNLPSKITPPSIDPTQKPKEQVAAEDLRSDLEHLVKNLKAKAKTKISGYPGVTKAEINGNTILIESEIADSLAQFVDSLTPDRSKSDDLKKIYLIRIDGLKFNLCLDAINNKLSDKALKYGYEFQRTIFTINRRFVARITVSKEKCF